MAKETISPLEALEQKHLKETETRRAAIAAATKEVRDCEALLKEAKEKVRCLQAEQLNASFAYDAARALLEAGSAKAA